jgi:hypothetical protein
VLTQPIRAMANCRHRYAPSFTIARGALP